MLGVAEKKIELYAADGQLHDSFVLKHGLDWPETVIWGRFEGTKIFVRDKHGKYREASYAFAPMPPIRHFNGDWSF